MTSETSNNGACCFKETIKLAQHKDVHPDYIIDRTSLMQVTPGAQQCVSSNRTQLLSRPKMHQENIKTETSLEHFPVSIAAMRANAFEPYSNVGST